MTIDLSPPSVVGRIRTVSTDGTRLYLELPDSAHVITVDSDPPLGFPIGTVVLVRAEDDHIEVVPDHVWSDSGEPPNQSWVGTVVLRHEDLTIIDTGVAWRPVPTNDVEYKVGNTVEGRDASGVVRVLDADPLLRRDAPSISDAVIAQFKPPKGQETFEDFGGLDAVKEQARELVELPLLRRAELDEIGARPIKGVLFTGDPGSGKTMLARIIANHTDAAFYEISGPRIFSKWYGESEELLRKIFEDAKRQRSIIFFDEIDSVAAQRSENAHEASIRVVAQLLTLMDGFEREDNVVVIAATNRPDTIDDALRRPGRFDWEVHFPFPEIEDRQAILRTSSIGLHVKEPLPHAHVAAMTAGWSAAELAGIWKEAALFAVKDRRRMITSEDYRGAVERLATRRENIRRNQEVDA